METELIRYPSLEEIDEALETQLKDTTVKVIGPLNRFYRDLLNKIFQTEENKVSENKENLGLESIDMTSALMTKIVSDISNSGAPEKFVVIQTPNEDEATYETLYKAVESTIHDRGNAEDILLIKDMTEQGKQQTDAPPKDPVFNLQTGLESLVLKHGGRVFIGSRM